MIWQVVSLACQKMPANIVYIIMTNRLIHLVNVLDRAITKDEEFLPSILTLLTLHLWQTMDTEQGHEMKGEVIKYPVTILKFCNLF